MGDAPGARLGLLVFPAACRPHLNGLRLDDSTIAEDRITVVATTIRRRARCPRCRRCSTRVHRACYALFFGLERTFVYRASTIVPASPGTGVRRRPCGGCHGPRGVRDVR